MNLGPRIVLVLGVDPAFRVILCDDLDDLFGLRVVFRRAPPLSGARSGLVWCAVLLEYLLQLARVRCLDLGVIALDAGRAALLLPFAPSVRARYLPRVHGGDEIDQNLLRFLRWVVCGGHRRMCLGAELARAPRLPR